MGFGPATFRKSPGKGRGRGPPRKARRRMAIAVVLAAVFIIELLPLGTSDVPTRNFPSSTYGVTDDLAALQAEKNTRYDSPEVLRETRNVVDLIQPVKVEKTGPEVNYTLVDPKIPDVLAPGIFDEAQNDTDLTGTSIIQFLLEQPLSYWVYTNEEGVKTWSKGFLRPTIDINLSSPSILNLERWVPVDADHNSSTGDAGGNEVQARISLVMENLSFTPPQISLTPPFLSNWSLDFTGGLRLEVQRLAPTSANIPMELAFLKAFMYRGLNYVWIIDYNFSDLPLNYSNAVVSQKIRAGGSISEIIGNIINNLFGLGNGTSLADIAGPYIVQVFTSPLFSVTGVIGYAKAVNLQLQERGWVKFSLSPGAGSSSLPPEMQVWLDSPSFASSFNHLIWTSSGPVRLDAQIFQDQATQTGQVNTTYAEVSMHDIPTSMELRLDNTSTDGTPSGMVRLDCSAPVGLVEYNEFEMFGAGEYRHMHVKLTDLPTSLTLTGTFDVARSTPPAINNLGPSLVARILDNTMTRLANKFFTIARTLRSIPDNLLHASERAGWTDLEIPAGEQLGAVEMWLASGPYIVRDGSFLAFYNLTLPRTDNPLLNVSFSARLEGLTGLRADFRQGNHIDLRTSVRQRFTAVFVDDNRGSNATLDIFPLPTQLVLDMDRTNRTLSLYTSDKVLSIDYLGWEGAQFLKVSLQDLPTQFTIKQMADQFYLNASEGQVIGRVEILSTNADLYSLDGNFLLVKSGPDGTSFGASLSDLSSAGYATGPGGKLELSLASPEPLRIYIENSSQQLRARMMISPIPSTISIGMSNLLGGNLKVPDLMNATSLLGFSTAVFAITRLGADVLGIADQVAGFVDQQMSGIGQNSTFSLTTTSDTVLVGDIQKGNLTEAPWTHGITSRHIQVGDRSYYNTKLYLRLARQTTLSSASGGDNLSVSIEMDGFHPLFDWMLFDLRGMAGRDILAYLTGLPTKVDLRVDANITQNSTYGREMLKADMGFSSSETLGPFLAEIARKAPENTRVLMFASSLPPDLSVNAYLAEKLELKYSASDTVRYLYVKNSRLVAEQWRSSTVLLHDIPKTVDVSLVPPSGFDPSAGPSQMLPALSVSADQDTLDMFVDLDGRSSGQRSSYQVEIKDAGEFITARHDGDLYSVRSSGTDQLYLRVRDMPYRKDLTITALGLYVENLRSLDLKISMVFGAYPLIQLSSLKVDSIHLSVSSKMTIAGQTRDARLVLADSRSGGGLPEGVALFTNGFAAGASNNDEHLIVPMPIATLIWSLLGG